MRYWIQRALKRHHKGALHKQLGYKPNTKIPSKVLREIQRKETGQKFRGKRVTTLMKRRVNFALNVRKLRKR